MRGRVVSDRRPAIRRGDHMERSTAMDHEAADRISAAADRESNTAQSGFDERAQGAADSNDG
jgi:hypothetical protein